MDSPEPESDPTASLLRDIEADAEGRLRLAANPAERPVLRGLRFDADSLRPLAARAETTPPWWQAEGASLRGAMLAGSELPDADFSRADLTGADLSRVVMRAGRLQHARLEGAQFTAADLSGADFTGVQASEADFSEALLEDARFPDAVLRFAKFTGALLDGANLDRADLWAARLDGAEALNCTLRGAKLYEATLAGADLTGANLENAELKKANLRGAKLHGADLRGADLVGADLTGADLSAASLPRVDLSSCALDGVRLAGAWLQDTRFTIEQLGAGLGEELAGEFALARRGYFSLEQNFRGNGDPEAARWCYLRARRMGKRGAWAGFRDALRQRTWRELPLLFGTWLGDAFAEWLCDYGESLPRVLRAFCVTVLLFAGFYAVTGTLVQTEEGTAGLAGLPSHNLIALLGFSFLNMCTSGIPDIGLKPGSHVVYFISSLQYVLGLVLIGLFGYVLGNRIRR
jgi:uncharacterized protein YjbI with pentapeptide repeats